MRLWLCDMGLRWFPVVGWAERGGGPGHGHGNSVPRFHVTWGTGPGVLEHFLRRCKADEEAGLVKCVYRHHVDRIEMTNGAAAGVSGSVFAADDAVQGAQTTRTVTGEFRFDASSVIVASGGIGGNFEMIKKVWPQDRLGAMPQKILSEVPAYVDGRMIDISQDADGH